MTNVLEKLPQTTGFDPEACGKDIVGEVDGVKINLGTIGFTSDPDIALSSKVRALGGNAVRLLEREGKCFVFSVRCSTSISAKLV